MKGREAQSQLGKTGAYGETDLDVALLGFVCSRANRSALEIAHASWSSGSGASQHVATWPRGGRCRFQRKFRLIEILEIRSYMFGD